MAGVSDDLPCFPHTSLGVDVLEGGKLISDDVLGRLNYSLQGFLVQFQSQAVMQPVKILSTVQLSEDFGAQTEFLQLPEEEETPVGRVE